MKESNRIIDRLGAHCRIKSHRIAGRRSDARTEGGRIEWLHLTVDEQARLLGAMLGAFSGIIDATPVTSDFLRGAGDGDVGMTAQGLA